MFEDITVEQHRAFIKQFDGLNPNNGVEHNIQTLADGYNDVLDELEENQKKLRKVFELGAFDAKKMERNKNYPLAIRRMHDVFSIGLSAVVLVGASLGLNLFFGGDNMEAWSNSLYLQNAATAAIPAVVSYITLATQQKKHFNREKPVLLDKLLMKRVKKRERSQALVATTLVNNMEDIIKGTYDIYKIEKYTATERTKDKNGNKKKTEVEKTRIVLKDEFKGLSRFKRRKMQKLFKNIKENHKELKNTYDQLSIYKENANIEAILTNPQKHKIATLFAEVRGKSMGDKEAAEYYYHESLSAKGNKENDLLFQETTKIAETLASPEYLSASRLYACLDEKGKGMSDIDAVKHFIEESKDPSSSYSSKIKIVNAAQELLQSNEHIQKVRLYAEVSEMSGISDEEAAILFVQERSQRVDGKPNPVFTQKLAKVNQALGTTTTQRKN